MGTPGTLIGPLQLALLLALTLTAALWDLRAGRIPNALTYGGLLLGLGLAPFTAVPGVAATLGGTALAFLPAFLAFAFGGLGGGDVKLLAAVGALVGYPLILDLLFYSIVVGTVLALAIAIWHGRVLELLGGLWRWLQALVWPGLRPVTPTTDLRVPFAVAIAGGSLWTLLLPGLGPAGLVG